MALEFRPIRQGDWDWIRKIYREGLASGQASFETEPPNWERWDADHAPNCRIVALDHGIIVGWAALTPFSSRAVYRGVAEASVYVASRVRGRGVGSELLGELIRRSELAGYWTLLAKIFPENEASLSLVEKHGFRQVGRLEAFGRHGGRWRDVILVERRAPRSDAT
jgi:phosphinothricin acetyltransferase